MELFTVFFSKQGIDDLKNLFEKINFDLKGEKERVFILLKSLDILNKEIPVGTKGERLSELTDEFFHLKNLILNKCEIFFSTFGYGYETVANKMNHGDPFVNEFAFELNNEIVRFRSAMYVMTEGHTISEFYKNAYKSYSYFDNENKLLEKNNICDIDNIRHLDFEIRKDVLKMTAKDKIVENNLFNLDYKIYEEKKNTLDILLYRYASLISSEQYNVDEDGKETKYHNELVTLNIN